MFLRLLFRSSLGPYVKPGGFLHLHQDVPRADGPVHRLMQTLITPCISTPGQTCKLLSSAPASYTTDTTQNKSTHDPSSQESTPAPATIALSSHGHNSGQLPTPSLLGVIGASPRWSCLGRRSGLLLVEEVVEPGLHHSLRLHHHGLPLFIRC
jgi:hypothetical protein